MKQEALPSLIKNLLFFILLFVIIIIQNEPIISFDMMYQEQPSIYVANQTITSWEDLLNIYLHPTWFHMNIPFFRPSGHFLMYQIITPFIGWHNTKAFTLISLLFLTGIGFFSIKLYQLLFPSFKVGGIIAFSIYIMHPALSISRLTIMHFDFAYVFFAVLSLYLFVRFCCVNETKNASIDNEIDNKIKFHNYHLFVFSLVFFAIAITFKESAIMLGPVLFLYYVISQYHKQPLLQYIRRTLFSRPSIFILLTIFFVSVILSWYLFLTWPSMTYASHSFHLQNSLGTANIFLKDIFGVKGNYIYSGHFQFTEYLWRTTVFTPAARYIMWFFFWLSITSIMLVSFDKKPSSFAYKKSLLFLFISSIGFLALPLSWASGAPWHHSLLLICYSMIMGFSAEYCFHRFTQNQMVITWSCIFVSSLIALVGMTIHFENVIKYMIKPGAYQAISLNRNAVLFPPDIKNQLNQNSIIVVEDSTIHNDYFLGNAAYPMLLFITGQEYSYIKTSEKKYYLNFHHTYGGNLFRYAYLMPKLKEELYPFKVEQMEDIPNEIIYPWLKNYHNIFCVGYDASGNWINKTELFKKNLASEQSARMLKMNHYRSSPVNTFNQNIINTMTPPVPDEQLCQYSCDQNKQCSGFIYAQSSNDLQHHTQCYLYDANLAAASKPCPNCINYIKSEKINWSGVA